MTNTKHLPPLPLSFEFVLNGRVRVGDRIAVRADRDGPAEWVATGAGDVGVPVEFFRGVVRRRKAGAK